MEREYLLAGDIGGTNILLELFESRDGRVRTAHGAAYRSAAFAGFEAVLDDFFGREPVHALRGRIGGACFAVAGPVRANAAQLSNLPWYVDGAVLEARYDVAPVLIVNDFAAIGHGITALGEHDVVTLQQAPADPRGPRLAVGAGTGLGVCILTWNASRYVVHASEAGHVDFAPGNATQDALLAHLRADFGHVSYERVVSGPGLLRIFGFLQQRATHAPCAALAVALRGPDAPAAISRFAIDKCDPLAERALDLFVEIYGAFAGNMALATLARGGVYLAGGIARQIAVTLADGRFVQAFTSKGRFAEFLRGCPVHVVTDPKVGIKGALRILCSEQGISQRRE